MGVAAIGRRWLVTFTGFLVPAARFFAGQASMQADLRLGHRVAIGALIAADVGFALVAAGRQSSTRRPPRTP